MTEKVRIAINGFGRIGRLTLRRLLEEEAAEVVAINDLTDKKMLAHLFRYDSVHGRVGVHVETTENGIQVGNHAIQVFSEADPANLPWGDLKVDVVVEATGIFRSAEEAGKHLQAGASKVVISAPAKGDVVTVVSGVNDDVLSSSDQIVSNASCTTNCLAPMMKVLDEAFGVEKGYITTIHAYTADQRLQDAPHSDMRRARAAALSIIPTTTGAAVAVGKVLPNLQGKLDGAAMRVPVPDGSITDAAIILKRDVTADEINTAMKAAADGAMKGIMEYSTDPLVSVDIIGNPHSCIFDSKLTTANGNLVKVVGWYDNEYGYSCRTAELVMKLAELGD